MQGQDAEQMVGFIVVGMLREKVPVQCFGVSKVARLMLLDGGLKSLFNLERRHSPDLCYGAPHMLPQKMRWRALCSPHAPREDCRTVEKRRVSRVRLTS